MQVLQERLKKQRWIRIFINTALVLFMFFFIARYIQKDWQEIQKTHYSFNLRALWITLGLYAINFCLLMVAWLILLKCFGALKQLSYNAFLYSYTYLYRFLPTPVWFIGSRIYYYGQLGIGKRTIVTTTALETLLHMFTGFIIYCLLLIDFKQPITWLYSLSVLLIILGIYHSHWFELRWINRENSSLRINKTDFTLLLSLYFITWIISGPFFKMLIQIIYNPVQVSMVSLMRIWIISSLFAYVGSYTLGGVGVIREFSLTILLSKYLPPSTALVIIVLVRLVMTLGGVLWALTIVGIAKLFSRFKRMFNLHD